MSKPVVPMCDQFVGGTKGFCDHKAKRYLRKDGEDVFLCDTHAKERQKKGEVLTLWGRKKSHV